MHREVNSDFVFYYVTYVVTSPIPSMNQPPIIHYN